MSCKKKKPEYPIFSVHGLSQAMQMPTFLQQFFLSIGTGHTWCQKGSKWCSIWLDRSLQFLNLCQNLKMKKCMCLCA